VRKTPHKPEDKHNEAQKLIDQLNKKRWIEEQEAEIAKNSTYPLTDKLTAFWRISSQTSMLFRLAEMHLKNAEFQLGRYHAAVAEKTVTRNILDELSNELSELITEISTRSMSTSDDDASDIQAIVGSSQALKIEQHRLMRELENKRRIQFLEAQTYFVFVYNVQKTLKRICKLEKEDVELQEFEKELDSFDTLRKARRLLEHLDGDIAKGYISDLGNLTGNREEVFTYQYAVEGDKVESREAYLTESEFMAVKRLMQRVFEILGKRPPESGMARDSKTPQGDLRSSRNYYQGNVL